MSSRLTSFAPFSASLLCLPWVINCVSLGFSDSKFCQQVGHRCLHPATVLGHSGVHGAQQPRPLPEGGTGDHHRPTHSPSPRVSEIDAATGGGNVLQADSSHDGLVLVWLNIYRKRILIWYIIKPCLMFVPVTLTWHSDLPWVRPLPVLEPSVSLVPWSEKAMAPHSSTLAWKIPWTEESGRPQSMGSLRVGHDWVTSLSLFTFMHWRRKWQPTPVFLPGESQGRGSLVGCCQWGRTGSDTTEAA